MRGAPHRSRVDRIVAKAVSLVVHPARDTTSAVGLLTGMADGDASVLRRAVARLEGSGSDRPSNVVEETLFLLRLALAQADRRGPS